MKAIRRRTEMTLQFLKYHMIIAGVLIVSLVSGSEAWGQESSYDEAVQKNLQEAYAIAQTLFTDNALEKVSLSRLQNYGFRPSEDVTIRVLDGAKGRLRISGTHFLGSSVFLVDGAGNIIRQGGNNSRRRGVR